MSEERRMQCCCYDCGRRYGDEYGFPDLVVPNEAWTRISPLGDEGGLLCPSCICRRLHLAGLETSGRFTSGPLGEPPCFYIVGQTLDDGRWSFQGVFDSLEKAKAACRNSDYFVGPATLNQELPDEECEWPEAYRPGADQ